MVKYTDIIKGLETVIVIFAYYSCGKDTSCMKYTKEKKIPDSPMMTELGKNELYLYSLKKMAEQNVQNSRISLTNLFGKHAFFFEANECIRANEKDKYALIRMDIYRFKTVNEFCGRAEGDRLLRFIADSFRKYESKNTVVGHMRADIFVICTPFEDKQELIDIVTDINAKIATYPIPCKILPSFGICIAENNMDVSLMTDYANLALQRIKGKVFSWYSFYDDELRQELLFEKKIENEVLEALGNKYLAVFIQPKVDMTTGAVIGGEALVRWKQLEEGYLYPDQFIPVLEKSGYIIDVDIYVWNEVFRRMRDWISAGGVPLPISLNVSRMHAYQSDFKEVICSLAHKYQIDPKLIKLEVTESVLSENEEEFYKSINFLQDRGFEFSMDDFGSGYSSMNMLKDEPIDEVKLDKKFLDDISDRKGRIIIQSIIMMIQKLNIDMIAEGVETQEQAEFLMECGCYKAQGYYYYQPMPIENFEKLLQKEGNKMK